MKIPHAKSSSIPDRKITGYLLSPAHPAGGSKAVFFIRHGFSIERWTELKSALLRHAVENEFVGYDGHTVALLTLDAALVRPLNTRDIPHVRELVAA